MKTHLQTCLIKTWLTGFTLLATSLIATATVFVKDPFPIASGAYVDGVSVYGTTPAHADIKGFSGKWDSVSATSVMQSRSFGLSYPENILLSSSYGCLTISNSTAGETTGRVISRAVTGVPTSGTLYYSVLIKADSTALSMLAANQTYGIGFGTTWKPSNAIALSLPTDGLYFGFWKNASGAKGTLNNLSLILRVNGANTVLLDAPTPGQTYLCVARIEIGAGTGGAEIVSAVVNPTMPTVFTLGETTTVESELINATSFTYLNVGGLYATSNSYVYFDEILLADTLQEAAFVIENDTPSFEFAPTVTLDPTETDFVFTAKLSNATGDIDALIGSPAAYDVTNLVATAATTNAAVTLTLSGLTTNTCYTYAAQATWDDGDPVIQAGARAFYTGVISVNAIGDADEDSFVNGSFTVERADSTDAMRADLLVDYVVSGTAIAGQNYVALPGSVVIPAGTNRVDIIVQPLIDGPTLNATSLTLSILPTVNYTNETSSATIAINSVDLPAGKNVWIAPSSGNASVAANWSENRVPLTSDDIYLGLFSTANMTWDAGVNGLPTNAASWVQTSDYTGAVTIDTRRGGTFDMFHVTGNATLEGGSWTHPFGDTVNTIGLRCTVHGNLTTGSAFTFDGFGRGYRQQNGPSGTGSTSQGIAHGGEGGLASSGPGTVYDDCFTPVWRGSSATFTSGAADGGGGAFYIVVSGAFTHNGHITVTGPSTASYPAHSGGSIFIQAATLSGIGELNAKAGAGASVNKRVGGGGGRIAIHLTEPTASFASFTNGFTGILSAAGSTCSKYGSTDNHYPGSCGTVLIDTPTDDNILVLDNVNLAQADRDTLGAAVIRNAEIWNLKKVILRRGSRIAIAAGGKLKLPSPSSIESDGHAMNALRFDGNGILEFTNGSDTTLDVKNYSILSTGTSSYAGAIRLTDPCTLKVDEDFTVGGLKLDGVPVAPGTYNAADLSSPRVLGSGVLHILPSKSVTVIIIR